MTDARFVWDTWRRILRSDALVEAALRTGVDDPAALALSAPERAVLAEYASTPVATELTVRMYRRGLVRNALAALKLVPLTRRLLESSGHDVRAVAADFARSIGYRDDGPHLWRTAAGFVDHLAGHPAFAAPWRQDVLMVEAAAVALVRRLGEAGAPRWPGPATGARAPTAATDRFVASPTAVVVTTDHDLTPWMEHPSSFDADAELDRSPHHWLVYVPAADAAHAYAELSGRAARAVALLAEPRRASELSPALEGLSVAEVVAVIDSLAEVGAVVREGAA